MTIGFAVGGATLLGLVALNVRQALTITDLKSGAFAKLAAHVATPEERAVVDRVASGPEPVRLPRASVRDPLPPADGDMRKHGVVGSAPVVKLDAAGRSQAEVSVRVNRLTKVGRLKMQASHPRYSAATHERARAELDAMGLTPKGNPKRKHK